MQTTNRIGALRDVILKAKHAYYYSNDPIISDAEYDALEDELRQLSPEDPTLTLVGAPAPVGSMLTKAKHTIPMGSQNKVNSEDEFRVWAAKWPGGAIHASLKGDGASAAAYYKDGRLQQVISRGDGVIGEDITANALRFKGLPAWAGDATEGFSGAVRLEVILTIEDWGQVDPSRSKNPRNAGNGIMGRKNGHQSDLLTTFAFDLDETLAGESVQYATESAKLARLGELGFNVIGHQYCETIDEAVDYYRRITEARPSLPIWIDGVVLKFDELAAQLELGVSSGCPKGQVAWKFDSVGVETVLEGVVVSGGHTGALIPTAQLRPVEIGGTTVSNATLANYDEIIRLDVAIGDSVWVVKANDIIPKIIRVTQRPEDRTPIIPPSVCPFCEGEVGRRQTFYGASGVIVECRNPECSKKSSGKIRRWIRSLDIKGIGDSVLETILDSFGIEDAADLYRLRERQDEMAGLILNTEKSISLGVKRTANILGEIDTARDLTLERFLGSLGLEHLGKRRVKLIMQAAKGGLDTLDSWRDGKLRNPDFAADVGVPNIGSQIQDGIDAMSPVIDKLLASGVSVLPPENDIPEVSYTPVGTVCISGKLPSGRKKADYTEQLKTRGFTLVDRVSKGLTYLVLADTDSSSSKAVKARSLGIEVISEDELEKIITDRGAAVQSPPPIVKEERPEPLTRAAAVVGRVEAAVPDKPSAVAGTTTVSGQTRRFEYKDEKSSKFWAVLVNDTDVVVTFGRIGTVGQTKTKSFDTSETALRHAEKLTREKAHKGYIEIN
jgi:DNA ligase (NAD+)